MSVDGSVNVRKNFDRLVGSVHQTTREEGKEEHQAVVQLSAGPGHAKLVKEPVDVEEGSRQLPENEDATVVVEKGSLVESDIREKGRQPCDHDRQTHESKSVHKQGTNGVG